MMIRRKWRRVVNNNVQEMMTHRKYENLGNNNNAYDIMMCCK